MKCIRGVALCLALAMFCGGLTGCTDSIADTYQRISDTQERIDEMQNELDNMPAVENITTTAQTSITTTTRRTSKTTVTTTTKKLTTTKTPTETMVWVSGSGKRYHCKSNCSGMKSPKQISLSDAQQRGLTPCKNCY